MAPRLVAALAFGAGAAMAGAFAPFHLWPLAVLCPAWLLWLWRDASPRRAAQLGFWFTSGTFLAGTYWIYHSVHIIGQAPIWLALFLMAGLVAIMGGYTAGLGWLQARYGRPGFAHTLIVVPAAWVLVEWFRGWFLSGFPWLALGYAQLDTPLSGWAPVTGVYGLTLFVMITAGALVIAAEPLLRRSKGGHVAGALRLPAVAAAIGLVPWIAGAVLARVEWTEPSGSAVSVAIVQGAVPQTLKWTAAQRDVTLDLYRDLTRPHLGADLILWPEATLPDPEHELRAYLAEREYEARRAGSDMVVGMLHYDFATRRFYNGLQSLKNPERWYDKRRLVPFGEFFPVPDFVRNWMRLMSLPYTDISPGPASQPPLEAAGHRLGATICYEDAYGSDQLAILREATLLVNVTNDAWFGDSTAPHQHLEISRMRALEAGRPLLRGANDGITAIVGADGALIDTLPQFAPGVLTGTVQPRRGLTPYARTGNWPAIGACVLLWVAGGWTARRAGRGRQPVV